jgi:membrane fusion protein (multidrug efflux system)
MNRPERPEIALQERPRKRRLWLWLALVTVPTVLILVAVIGFPIGAFIVTGFPAQPPTAVATIVAHLEPWQPQIQTVGTLHPVRGADLSVEVAGIVDEVGFDSGGDVDAGMRLIRLRDFDDVAKLRTLEASRDLAQVTFNRDKAQLDRMLISQAQFDVTASNLKSLQAQVAEQQAIVAKKTLRAPFAGHLGLRNVNVGQYIAPGTVVATLQALDPIFLDFFLPQQVLGQINVGIPITLTVDTYPNQTFQGKITTIDPKVDIATRNVSVRATIPNPDRKLLPGMFANLQIVTGEPQSYITLPQTAITFNPYGNMVYVVEDGADAAGKSAQVVRQTVVTTGTTRGDQIAVTSGLKEGDVVVSSGQMKLQNGGAIAINNTIQPSNDPNPRPVER